MKHEAETLVERKAPGGMAADFRVPQGLGAHVWLLASAALVEAMGGATGHVWACGILRWHRLAMPSWQAMANRRPLPMLSLLLISPQT